MTFVINSFRYCNKTYRLLLPNTTSKDKSYKDENYYSNKIENIKNT